MLERHPSAASIIPKGFLSQIIFLGYLGLDARTALFATHSVSYSIYLSFIFSNIFFFFFEKNFFELNFMGALSACIITTALSFFKFALDQAYFLDRLYFKRFLSEIILMPIFIVLLYFAFYVAARHDLTPTKVNIYLVYVLLHSLYVGVVALCFSHFIINILRVWEVHKS